MTPRHVPPAHSPLSLAALGAAARAALRGADPALRLSSLVARRWRARRVLLVDGGTSALSLALRAAAAARPGRPVALPAYGCYDLATAAEGAEVPVVLYDVDPRTLAPQADSLARVLACGPAAVVLVHLFGVPVDVPAWAERVAAAGALLVEDAAQGIGARVRGRPAGGWGSLAVLSFGRGKGLTGGGGGALLAGDARGEAALRAVEARVPTGRRRGGRALAGAAIQWALARPGVYALPASIPALRLGETVHHPPSPVGAITAASAALVAAVWRASHGEAATRRRNAARLLRVVAAGEEARAFPVVAGCEPGYLRLPVLARGAMRDAVARGEASRLGVMPGYPLALADLPGFGARCLNADEGFPGARTLARRLVTLPTHGMLTERDVAALERWVLGVGSRAAEAGTLTVAAG